MSLTLYALTAAGGVAGYVHLKKRIDVLEMQVAELDRNRSLPADGRLNNAAQPVTQHPPALVTAPPTPVAVPTAGAEHPFGTFRTAAAPAATPAEEDLFEMPTMATQKPESVWTRTPAPPPSAFAQATDSLVALVKKNPFASLGVLLMLVGVGFLFALLAASNILPPPVRVAALMLVGAGVFGFGLRQEKTRYGLALNLQGGGLAVQFLCALWAYQGYNLVSPLTAFIWMGGLSTLSIGWAAWQRRGLFAFMGLAGSLLTPIFASTGQGEFSGLVMYCLWVSVLALSAGYYLRMPSLASAALAGTSALLAGALSIAHGSSVMSAAGLLAMAITYCTTAILWTRKNFDWSARSQASIVAVLVSAPLIMAGFLYSRAEISAEGCAVWIGLASVAYLANLFIASEKWKAGLFAIGAGLGLVALGVGLDGAGRALAISAAALGLVMAARALKKEWADIGAAVYWVVSLAMGIDLLKANDALSAMPLGISGAVALAGAYFARGTAIGGLYALAAPLVLATASLWTAPKLTSMVPVWFLVWAALSTQIGKAVRWPELRMSALWLLPAGLVLFIDHLAHPLVAANLFPRELLLLSWLVGSAFLVRAYLRDDEIAFSMSIEAQARASLLLPILATVEIGRTMDVANASGTAFLASTLLLWTGWHVGSRIVKEVRGFDAKVQWSGVVAFALLGANILLAKPSLGAGLVQGVCILLLALAIRRFPSAARQNEWLSLLGFAGAFLLGAMLRSIGQTYGLQQNVVQLLVARDMQPWVSVLWAAASITVVAVASKKSLRSLWMGGGIAVLILIAKMLLIDLATLTLPAKVAVFLVTGAGFVALGYFCPLPPDKAESREALPNE